jgi:MprA protease rhombosortase-interaction domain-containing protein
VIREVPADGPDPTLAVVMSGAALLVAAGAAGYARRSQRHGRLA